MTTSSSPVPESSQEKPNGKFYTGTDLGKKRDNSAIALIQKIQDQLYLLHVKRFKLGTEYASVLGYLKLVNLKLERVHRNLIDQTGIGEFFVEEARKTGLTAMEGIMLSLPSKQQVMGYLKEVMQAKRLHLFYDVDLFNEFNVERYELTKASQIQFSHPEGTHDDRLWAVALAVYASRPEIPEYHPVVVVGKHQGSLTPNLPRSLWKH